MVSTIHQPHIYRSSFPPAPALPRGNLFDLISKRATLQGNETAFIRNDGRILSNAVVINLSRRLAYSFRNNLGLEKGNKVCIYSPNHAMYPIAIYACEIAGLIAVLVNPASTALELENFIDLSDSKMLLSHSSIMNKALKVTESRPEVALFCFDDDINNTSLEAITQIMHVIGEDELETVKIDNPEEETVFICFSSGTTGHAKGVEITHSNIIASLAQMLVTHDTTFSSNDLQIGVLPFCHIYGLVKLLHHPFMIGMPVVIMNRFDMQSFCQKIEYYKATITLLVPPIILLLSNGDIANEYNLGSLRIIQSGGAPLSPILARQVCSKWPNIRIVQGYGLTESCPSVICSGPAHLPSSFESVGRLAPGVEARLINEAGNDIIQPDSKGSLQQGELFIRGASIMKGYLNNPEANANAFQIDDDCDVDKDIHATRWFKTGDIAIYRNGEIFIVDRKKELIKYKGFQVPPAELEALLLTNSLIEDVIVIGIEDHSQATELPRAYIVPKDQTILNYDQIAQKVFTEGIIKWTAEKVSNHKRLRGGVFLVESIPKSSSGKLLRRIIRQQASFTSILAIAEDAVVDYMIEMKPNLSHIQDLSEPSIA